MNYIDSNYLINAFVKARRMTHHHLQVICFYKAKQDNLFLYLVTRKNEIETKILRERMSQNQFSP